MELIRLLKPFPTFAGRVIVLEVARAVTQRPAENNLALRGAAARVIQRRSKRCSVVSSWAPVSIRPVSRRGRFCPACLARPGFAEAFQTRMTVINLGKTLLIEISKRHRRMAIDASS